MIFRIRARVETNDVARRRIYRSLCGEYRVTESEPHYKDLSTIWYAEHCNAPSLSYTADGRGGVPATREGEKPCSPRKTLEDTLTTNWLRSIRSGAIL
jgi:hypothetical protein